MKVQVAIDGAGSTSLTGTVAEIDPPPIRQPQLSGQDRLAFFEPVARRNVWTAEFPNGLRQAILIPRSAVVMRGSLACAYVLDGRGIAQLRSLTLGAAQGNLVEVLSGISAGRKTC
jgi:DNA-binding transcriptional LysR family regulator